MTGAVCLADILSNGIIILQKAPIRSLRDAAGGFSEMNIGSRSLCCGSHLTLKPVDYWSCDQISLLCLRMTCETEPALAAATPTSETGRKIRPTGSVGIRKRSLSRRANRIPDWEGIGASDVSILQEGKFRCWC